MTLAGFEVDEAPHNMDGLLLHVLPSTSITASELPLSRDDVGKSR